ncbi:MAG: ParA family protein [Neomegalonema sp.]|nr:ParA family protein [Neomegalonema sp.]
MGKIISVVNRKGGVGKTTLSIALGKAFVSEFAQSVALVDLDPQGTASQVLMRDNDYANLLRREQQGPLGTTTNISLVTLMKSEETVFDGMMSRCRYGMVHNITGRADVNFDLYPIQDEFWEFEYEEFRENQGQELDSKIARMLTTLTNTGDPRRRDWVIIDCPPGFTRSSRAALMASDMILCPFTPDEISVLGIPSFNSALKKLNRESGTNKRCYWICNRYRNQGNSSARWLRYAVENHADLLLRAGGLAETSENMDPLQSAYPIFQDSAQVQNNMSVEAPMTLQQTFGNVNANQIVSIAKTIKTEIEQNG